MAQNIDLGISKLAFPKPFRLGQDVMKISGNKLSPMFFFFFSTRIMHLCGSAGSLFLCVLFSSCGEGLLSLGAGFSLL